MARVLIIDDSQDDLEVIRRAIGPNNIYTTALTFQAGRKCIENKNYDILLTDLRLPDGSGYALCEHSQRFGNREAPIVLLTASNSVETRIASYGIEVDDFVAKPFDPAELRARVESRLKKRQQSKLDSDLFMVGDIEVDRRLQRISFAVDGQYSDLSFTPIEFRIFLCLCRDVGRVYSRTELMTAGWGGNIHVCFRSVDTHISKLRAKLGIKSDLVQSVAGRGYRLRKENLVQTVSTVEPDFELHDILDFDTCWQNNLLHHFM